jgi:hypothetical protein
LLPAPHLRFSAIQAECLTLGCEIIGAEQSAKMPHHAARATLTARVPPAALAGFFKGLQAHGRLLSQSGTSEDKSAEVVDVEARIKNLEALKARVLELMAKQAGTLQDLLAAEKQLAETQAAFDSIHEQRRVLARDTEMVRLDIELVAESAGARLAPPQGCQGRYRAAGKVM